ncbi:hypothetical protein DXV76_20765 [Rhodobacteraceae bacterium CCMM004]|nr:hypothetical protein DXV76_20765 [Rhodobacteraceae bacterium CCMM004]
MRDLVGEDRPELQKRISREGWGRRYLDCRNPDGGWGDAFYKPNWTSTHYTLLELKRLQIAPTTNGLLETIVQIAESHISGDGGLGYTVGCTKSDVCINGMFLNYACYFGISETLTKSIIDFLLTAVMDDGGFNCRSNRSGARHSSLHSTLSVLEGILEYQRAGHGYRSGDLRQAVASSQEFILNHRLFKSDRTGKVINLDFLEMPYPQRWRYSALRALDYFRDAGVPLDRRMSDALDEVSARRRPDGKWPRYAAIPGKVHFVMEPPRRPSRWNTLIALRVAKAYPSSHGGG